MGRGSKVRRERDKKEKQKSYDKEMGGENRKRFTLREKWR